MRSARLILLTWGTCVAAALALGYFATAAGYHVGYPDGIDAGVGWTIIAILLGLSLAAEAFGER